MSSSFWIDTQKRGPDLVIRSVPKPIHDQIRREARALGITQADYLRRVFYMLALSRAGEFGDRPAGNLPRLTGLELPHAD